MLYSQGTAARGPGHPAASDGGQPVETDTRKIWRTFAAHYHLFRGTPTRMWLDHAFATVFGIDERLTAGVGRSLFRSHQRVPRASRRSGRARCSSASTSKCIATTESPLDPLAHHRKIRASGWTGRVVTAYRPDPVVDPEFDGLRGQRRAVRRARPARTPRRGRGYLAAHRNRRAFFKTMGATSTDHGHPTAQTSDLTAAECQRLLDRALAGTITRAGGRGVPRPDADRDGADEPRRRPRHADPPGQLPQSQSAGGRAASDATRAPTSRRAPTTSAR